MSDSAAITQLLNAAREGNLEAAHQLWSAVYDELREIAQRAVDREYVGHSIQATEIAHEAYLRFAAHQHLGFENRTHLLATVAQVVRRLLIDRARARNAEKRGGKLERVVLDDILDSQSVSAPNLVDLDTALIELEAAEPRHAKLVELRFFVGLTMEEAAAALQLSVRTVAGDWAFAKAWLRRRLEGERS